MPDTVQNDRPAVDAGEAERFGNDPAEAFRERLADVRGRIAQVCVRAGRDPASIRLLPITKTVPAHILRLAYAAGMEQFGENKVQEAEGKHAALVDLPVRWSIVGHLQTNKAKHLARFAREFHALDSLRVAEVLNHSLDALDRTLDVYVQVNTSGEASKYGLQPDELLPFLRALPRLERLVPRGLMTLAILSPDIRRVRPCFRLLRELRDQVRQLDPRLSELSMGMSGDFEAAIEEGADVVRVGRSIFGTRPTPPGHFWPGVPIEQG